LQRRHRPNLSVSGVLEWWIVGILDCWIIGLLECWSVVVPSIQRCLLL
jgi:hypothetical protein